MTRVVSIACRLLALALAIAAAPGAAQAFDARDVIASEIETVLLDALPWEQGDVEITDVDLSGYDGRPFDDLSVELPRRVRKTGKVTVSVNLSRDGMTVKRFWSSARVKVYQDAVVALEHLRMGQKIGPGDVTRDRVEMTRGGRLAEGLEDVVGMVVKRPISAGAAVKKNYIRPEVIVERGESVNITVSNDKLSIRSRGVAGEDGHKGGSISVVTPSGKEIDAVVTGPGEVTVSF